MKFTKPLTSAKPKHETWADVTADWYRIYEIINITKIPIKDDDVIVDIKNRDILNKIPDLEQKNYRQRILSVLDMRKMFTIKSGVYTEINFQINNLSSKKNNQKMALMMKEYMFLLNIADKIEEKTTKIYNKQTNRNKVLKYHCDYRKLEAFCDQYIAGK